MMTDARRKAARAAYEAVPHPYHLFEHIYAVCDAMLAYDAAHPKTPLPDDGGGLGPDDFEGAGYPQPEPRKEVVQHSGRNRELDKSAAPLVGADPPWLRNIALKIEAKWWIHVSEAERISLLVLNYAVAHLTDDAVVEAVAHHFCAAHATTKRCGKCRADNPCGFFDEFVRKARAALAAAGRALMGETDG